MGTSIYEAGRNVLTVQGDIGNSVHKTCHVLCTSWQRAAFMGSSIHETSCDLRMYCCTTHQAKSI